ncbi:MAG: AarF/ABC1/UbiB kinase family protein [Oligoflexales bacterium]
MGKRLFVAFFYFLVVIRSSNGRSENFDRDFLVRKAAITWIKASELEDVNERLLACRQNITEFLPILEWILDGEKIADIFMGSSLSFFIPEETMVKMSQIDKFVEQSKIIRKPMLNILNSVSPRLHKRILMSSKWMFFKILKSYLPTRCEELLVGIKANITKAKFSDTDFIHLLKSEETGISFDGVPDKIRAYLKMVLEDYFDHLGFAEKSRIIRSLLNLPAMATTSEQLASVLMRSGPILQKSFQLFGTDVKDPLLLEVMGKLRSEIKPFSVKKVEHILKQELGGEISDFFQDFDKSPIAAATIGQVHTGTLLSGDSVVIKIKRPGIEKKVASELQLLRSLTEDPAIISFVDELEKIMIKELDFLLEKEHLWKAKQIYSKTASNKIKIVSPLGLLDDSNNVIVMEKAKGNAIFATQSGFTEQLKADALLFLLEEWFEEALFGSGFFHADLHGGNIFLQASSSLRRIPLVDSDFSINDYHESEIPEYKLWLIDFGSVGILSQEMASSLLKLIVGLSFRSKELILSALHCLMSLSESHVVELDKFLDLLWTEGLDELSYLDSLFNKVIAMDLDLPDNIIQFYRGKSLIEKQIHAFVDSFDTKNHRMNSVKLRYEPETIYHKVLQRNILREILPFANLRTQSKRSLVDKDSRKIIAKYYLDLIAD